MVIGASVDPLVSRNNFILGIVSSLSTLYRRGNPVPLKALERLCFLWHKACILKRKEAQRSSINLPNGVWIKSDGVAPLTALWWGSFVEFFFGIAFLGEGCILGLFRMLVARAWIPWNVCLPYGCSVFRFGLNVIRRVELEWDYEGGPAPVILIASALRGRTGGWIFYVGWL